MARKSKTLIQQQRKWEDKISRSKQVRKNWRDLFRVALALEYLDGKQMPSGYDANEWITINNVYSHLKSQLPALYSADPYFYVKLRRSYAPIKPLIEMYEKRGKIRAAYLNYLKDELRLKDHVRLAVQDAMFAYGIIRVEHHSTLVENPDKGNAIKGEDENDLQGEDGNPLLEPEYIPINSRYRLARVHFDDFLWDEDSGPLECDWGWIAERVRTDYDSISGNPLFKKSVVKSLKGKDAGKDQDEQDRDSRKKGDINKDNSGSNNYFSSADEDKDPDLVILWKIYDLKREKWCIIAEGAEEPLLEEQDLPPGVERHPYAILRFTLRDDSPYPIPPMSQGIDVSKEYNMARSDLLKHRKRFNRKYEFWGGGVDDAEVQASKLESGDDGTIIMKNNPQQIVTPINDAPLDQMRYQEIIALKNDMIELFGGSSDESRGIAGAESATQAGILDARLQMKEGDALSMVIDFVRDIARKLDMLVQVHMDKAEVVRVSGTEGEFFEVVQPTDYEEIQGEYSYEVNVGATLPRLPQMERSSFIAFLQLVGNFPPLMTSPRLIKKMAELHHIEDETLVDELVKIGKQMMQAQQQAEPARTGSLPNVGESRPQSDVGGQVGGAAAPQNPMA